MLYQLPNGKVMRISLEEYLSLSDEELQASIHKGYGEEPAYNSYFVQKSSKEKLSEEDDDMY